MFRFGIFLISLASFSSGCTWAENDLNKGVAYGQSADDLTRKIDEPRDTNGKRSNVNAWLWRAAIDTVGFIPLQMADPRTGRIITQWYTPPGAAGERTQLTIEILDADLRRDTVRVSVAREVRETRGWVSAPAPALTAQQIEETILLKARALR